MWVGLDSLENIVEQAGRKPIFEELVRIKQGDNQKRGKSEHDLFYKTMKRLT